MKQEEEDEETMKATQHNRYQMMMTRRRAGVTQVTVAVAVWSLRKAYAGRVGEHAGGTGGREDRAGCV